MRSRRGPRGWRAPAPSGGNDSLRGYQVVGARSDLELVPAVLGPGVLAVAGIERPFLPVGDHLEPPVGDTLAGQVALGRGGAPVAQRQVVLVAAPLVAVAGHPEPHGGVG